MLFFPSFTFQIFHKCWQENHLIASNSNKRKFLSHKFQQKLRICIPLAGIGLVWVQSLNQLLKELGLEIILDSSQVHPNHMFFPRKIGKIREYGQKKGNALPIKEKQMCTIVKNRQKDKDSTK